MTQTRKPEPFAKKMTAKKQAMVVASLRGERLDVHLGTRTEKQWSDNAQCAIDLGVELPDYLLALMNRGEA